MVESKKSELKQKSLEALKEAETKLESLESLLRETIIAHRVRQCKNTSKRVSQRLECCKVYSDKVRFYLSNLYI